jgi:hypothetical protein
MAFPKASSGTGRRQLMIEIDAELLRRIESGGLSETDVPALAEAVLELIEKLRAAEKKDADHIAYCKRGELEIALTKELDALRAAKENREYRD